MAQQGDGLWEIDVPPGFHYRDDFVTIEEEALLAAEIGKIEFSTFEMRGVTAKRRVAFFGRSYDDSGTVKPPIPAFLVPYRDRIAAWASLEGDAFAMALINEYRPGAPIGWHRDAPQYGIVAGISLLATCRMKFRPYVTPKAAKDAGAARRTATHDITLNRRSAYLMTGASRSGYEHHIPAVASLRYSITFRTLRASHDR